jgi:hypothetical protein
MGAVIANAREPGSRTDRLRGLSPAGPQCVIGPIFEEVRGPLAEPADSSSTKRAKDLSAESASGWRINSIELVYRDQPPVFQVYETSSSAQPIVYMSTQFKPRTKAGFIRVDFSAQVSLVPAAGAFVGVGYSLYVKEDGGDGEISLPGEITCAGDDVCGYLEQTADGLWLAASTNELHYSSVSTSNFFRANMYRRVEIQVHLYPINDVGQEPGEVYMNGGFIGINAGW